MITFVAGTTGELVKLAPILQRLDGRYILATTAQQATQIEPLLDSFGLRAPDAWLARGARGRDLERNTDIPRWLGNVLAGCARQRRLFRNASAVVVHGDTMTTFLGAALGRLSARPVVHVEAGLRSGDLRHPFPEEAIRRVTSRLAALHYAPGPEPARAVERRGTVVDTGGNTIRDALDAVPDGLPPVDLPDRPFGVVSLHRFELINDRRLFRATLERLRDAPMPLLFVDHPVTVAALRRFGLDAPNRIPRLAFFEWVQLLRACSFVISDSGGAQEETFLLDLPCLVHRRRTERLDGLGETAVLSHLDPRAIDAFLAAPHAHRRRTALAATSPSDIVVDDLRRRQLI